MNKMRHVAISAVAIALFGLAQDPAHAFVVNIYDFNVDKATTTAGPLSTVMHDSFTDNIGLNRAGPITEPPSVLGNGIYAAPGGDFNGQSESAASAAGGYRVLDTTTGTVKPSSFPNSPGGPDYIQGATAILVTDTGPSNTAGLKSNDLIRVTGLFDLVSLTHPFEQYASR